MQYESSKSFENAAKCLKRIDAEGKKAIWVSMSTERLYSQVPFFLLAAISALQKAIVIDKETANFRNAAKHHQEIAEIYESDIIDLQGAKENWEQASILYMADDNPA